MGAVLDHEHERVHQVSPLYPYVTLHLSDLSNASTGC